MPKYYNVQNNNLFIFYLEKIWKLILKKLINVIILYACCYANRWIECFNYKHITKIIIYNSLFIN